MYTLVSKELPRLLEMFIQAQGHSPFGLVLSMKTIGNLTREVNVERAIAGEELLFDLVTWHTAHGKLAVFHDDLLKENTFRWVVVDHIGRIEILPIVKMGIDDEPQRPKITLLEP